MFDLERLRKNTFTQITENQRVQRSEQLSVQAKLQHGLWGKKGTDSVHLFYMSLTAYHIKAGDRVIDMNCGNGDFILKVAAKYPLVQFVGADASSALLDIAHRRAQELGLQNISFIQANLLNGMITRFNLVISIQNNQQQNIESFLSSDGVVFEAYYSEQRGKIIFHTPKRPRAKLLERKRIYHLPLRKIPAMAILGFIHIRLFASIRM